MKSAGLAWAQTESLAAEKLIELAWQEDLAGLADCTTSSLVADRTLAAASFVPRKAGILAGLPVLAQIAAKFDPAIVVEYLAQDGEHIPAQRAVARMTGPARSLLTAERTMLNFLCRLSGIATLTGQFVLAVAGTRARILDTRKTTPGWRALEKYAVRCGGGQNHRFGLYDAILIKDNHLAFGAEAAAAEKFTPAMAVRHAREYQRQHPAKFAMEPTLTIEVDSLTQLSEVLTGDFPANAVTAERLLPDNVLLDNMSCEQLREAVRMRDQLAPGVLLEASGGVNLYTVAGIAATGVERISVGAITHSAPILDLGLDWE
ncbi:MAG: carboxylating nicotinate-nucleotide diphosphorylase [Pirellulales bacterium]|nr:carboxylating nicotinate-nucleotide diphosphorylase [Pirellulales bacterium]